MPDFTSLDYVPPGALGSSATIAIAIVGLGGVLGAIIAGMAVRSAQLRRAQKMLESSLHEQAALALEPGPSRVVYGEVEPMQGSPAVAVEVEIEQRAVDHSDKNSRWHAWVEESRKTRARPFYLKRPDGERVRVQPNDDVLVIDELTIAPAKKDKHRLRRSVVRAGEMIYATGDLSGGSPKRAARAYRESAKVEPWVLTPGKRERMLFATKALEQRYAGRATALLLTAIASSVVFVAMHAWVTAPFIVSTVFATKGEAKVTGATTYETMSKNTTIHHYSLKVVTADQETISADVPRATYTPVQAAWKSAPYTTTVPTLTTRGVFGKVLLGREPFLDGTPSIALLFFTVGWVLALGIARAKYRKNIPWYDQKKLDEYGGKGHYRESS